MNVKRADKILVCVVHYFGPYITHKIFLGVMVLFQRIKKIVSTIPNISYSNYKINQNTNVNKSKMNFVLMLNWKFRNEVDLRRNLPTRKLFISQVEVPKKVKH